MGIVVRKAALEDRQLIWFWWNDPITRRMMKIPDAPAWDTHCQWFDAVLCDPDRVLCIGLLDEEKIGVVRFDRKGDDIYEVSINFSPAFRGKGLAAPMLEESIAYLRQHRPVRKLFAGLKAANLPSKNTFLRAGFIYVDDPQVEHAGLEQFDRLTELYCERWFET